MTPGQVSAITVKINGDMTQYQRTLDHAQKATMAMTDRLKTVGTRLSLAITAPLAAIGGISVASFGSFNGAMTESTAIMRGMTESVRQEMSAQALELATKGTQGPTELARSYYFLASAGLNAEQAMQALPIVTTFAAAGAFDLARATDLLTDAQSALGLNVGTTADKMREMARVGDVLVKANTLANASVSQFSVSLTSQAGSTMKAFNKDVEEGVAVLAALADQGIKAELAGGNLSRVFRLLASSSRDSAAAHKRLGFTVFDTSGNMRNFADIVENLEGILLPLSPQLRSATLEQLGFAARIQQAVLPLLGTSKAIRTYEAELRKAGGTNEKVAKEQLKSFSNQLKITTNVIQVAAIELGKTLAPALGMISEVIRASVTWWRSLSEQTKSTVVAIAGVVAAVGPLLGMLGIMGAFGGTLSAAFAVIAPLLGPIIAGVTIVSVLTARWVQRVGGLEKAWEAIRETAIRAWNWIGPIRQALASLWFALLDLGNQVLTSLEGIALSVWATISSQAVIDWGKVRDAIRDTILFAEFTIKNFGQVWEFTWTGIQLSAISTLNTILENIGYILAGAAMGPILLTFVLNWKRVFRTIYDVAVYTFEQLAVGIQKFFANIQNAMRGKTVDWSGLWEGLQKEFTVTLAGVQIKTLTDLEARLREQFDAQKEALGQSFEEFRKQKLDQFVRDGLIPPAALKATEEVAKKAGGALKQSLEEPVKKARAEVEKFDSVLRNSAEAQARIAAYREKLAEGREIADTIRRAKLETEAKKQEADALARATKIAGVVKGLLPGALAGATDLLSGAGRERLLGQLEQGGQFLETQRGMAQGQGAEARVGGLEVAGALLGGLESQFGFSAGEGAQETKVVKVLEAIRKGVGDLKKALPEIAPPPATDL